jgi:pyrroline-5-carboxylate reductase
MNSNTSKSEIYELGICGCGAMGEALLSRLLKTNFISVDNVIIGEVNDSRRLYLQDKYNVATTTDVNHLIPKSKILILATKPQSLSSIIKDLSINYGAVDLPKFIVSIMAGVSSESLSQIFTQSEIVRVMPNTPALVGAGITAIAIDYIFDGEVKKLSEETINQVKEIFSVLGEVLLLPEESIDAVTGLSGSGPAYITLILEALADGGVFAGLTRETAKKLALHTLLGTAQLVKESEKHTAEIKDMVTSPAGTTIYGLLELEQAGVRSAIINAVISASNRAKELSL